VIPPRSAERLRYPDMGMGAVPPSDAHLTDWVDVARHGSHCGEAMV